MRDPPDWVKASWPKPNYVDPETRGPAMLVIQVILLIAVTSVLAMRIYARIWITRARLGLDDVLILLAYCVGVALSICVIIAVEKYGWNVHIWDMHPSQGAMSRKISWISMILYATTANLSKLSILAFYLRILVAKIDKWITKTTILMVCGYYIAVIVILFAQCQPFGYYWNMLTASPPKGGKCMDEGVHMVTSAGINLFLDAVIFLIPLRSLLALKIRTQQKIHLLLLFSAGILVVVAAVMRLYYVVVVMMKTYDVPWYGYMTWLWACVEAHIGTICACVPSCRAFFVAWSRSSLGSGSRSRNMSHYGPGSKMDATRNNGTVRSFVEDDVRGLTAGSERGGGVRTNIEAGGMGDGHSTSSGEYEREMKGRGLGGVHVQMEVLQYTEDHTGQQHQQPAGRRH